MAKQKSNTLSLTLNAFKEQLQKSNPTIIDTRLPDFFELGHIPNSINFGFNQSVSSFAKNLFNLSNDVLLICKLEEEETSVQQLQNLGFSNIIGYLEGGINTWLSAGEKYDMVISISAEELALDSKHNARASIIDIREADEFSIGHVWNAENFPLSKIITHYPKIEKNTELLIYCDKGFRSMIVASLLKVIGFTNIKNVWGGYEQIIKETVEIKKGS